MGKIYKGYELLKEIADGNIKSGTEFYDKSNREKYKYENRNFVHCKYGRTNLIVFLNHNFEIIEEEIIDIDSIEELQTGWSESGAETDIIKYINKKVIPRLKEMLD